MAGNRIPLSIQDKEKSVFSTRRLSPSGIFLRTLAVIAVVEFWVMAILFYLEVPEGLVEFIADSVLLSALSAPFLYLWVIRVIENIRRNPPSP